MNERRLLGLRVLIILVLLGLAAPAVAQQVPDEDMAAVGGEIGFFFPKEIFETALVAAGTLDYYFDPRFSIRGSIGWTDPNFENSGDSLRQIRLAVDGIYNWEHGKWHPFAGAGLGAYFLQHKFDGRSTGLDETQAAFRLGGGVEYFPRLMTTIKGELMYHFVDQGELPWSPSGLTLTIGVKRYF